MLKIKKGGVKMKFIPEIKTIEQVVEFIEKELNLHDDLLLNIHTLDDNWLDQPTISFQWRQLLNVAEHCLKVLERQFKEKSSEHYLTIKSQYAQDGTKVTEAALAHEVTNTQSIVSIQAEIVEAQYIVNLLTSVTRAVEDRKRSLDGLTHLYTSNYFQNQVDAPALKELGDAKVQEHQTDVVNKNERFKKLMAKRKRG